MRAVRGHLRQLRNRVEYRNALIVNIIEANGNWVNATLIDSFFQDFGPVESMKYNKDIFNRAGVLTGSQNHRKIQYAKNAVYLVQRQLILFAERLVGANVVQDMDILLGQMQEIIYVYRETKDNAFMPMRVTVSGKKPGKSTSALHQDDSIMCLMIGLSHAPEKMAEEAFQLRCDRDRKAMHHPALVTSSNDGDEEEMDPL